MPEPTSTTAGGLSLSALAIALLGPLAGPYAVVLFAALAGSLWPLMSTPTGSTGAGAWLLVRCTLTSLVLTGFASSVLASQYGWQAQEWAAPVSFGIAALGNGWQPVIAAIGSALASIAGRAGNGQQQGGEK